MLSFSVIIFYSAVEIGLYLLYRKKVIAAFKLNEKIVRSRYSFPRKKTMICLSQAKPLKKSHYFVYVRERDILRSTDAQCNTEESP